MELLMEIMDQSPRPGFEANVASNSSIPELISQQICYNEETESSEQEPRNEYKKGGYHVVKLGELLNNRYHVIRKLGWGEYSTVWLCWDFTDNRFVAIKVVKSGSSFTCAAKDEIKILKLIEAAAMNSPNERVISLLADFEITGDNGKHICMVFEVQGCHLLKWIVKSNEKGLPLPIVKAITKQILEGLHFLHTQCGIIHTDLKPENILLCVDDEYCWRLTAEAIKWQESVDSYPPESAVSTVLFYQKGVKKTRSMNKALMMNDEDRMERILAIKEMLNKRRWRERPSTSGCSKYGLRNVHNEPEEGPPNQDNYIVNLLEPRNAWRIKVKIADLGNSCMVKHQYSDLIQTMPYRSFEVIIRAAYHTSADIWSAACLAFELATGRCLFQLKPSENLDQEIDHIAQIRALFGSIPRYVARAGRYSRDFFSQRGEFKFKKEHESMPLLNLLQDQYGWNEVDAAAFSNFLLPMFKVDPKERATAAECLNSSWLQGTVVPHGSPLSLYLQSSIPGRQGPKSFSIPAKNPEPPQTTSPYRHKGLTTIPFSLASQRNQMPTPASGSTPVSIQMRKPSTCLSTGVQQVHNMPSSSANPMKKPRLAPTTNSGTPERHQLLTSTTFSQAPVQHEVLNTTTGYSTSMGQQVLSSNTFLPIPVRNQVVTRTTSSTPVSNRVLNQATCVTTPARSQAVTSIMHPMTSGRNQDLFPAARSSVEKKQELAGNSCYTTISSQAPPQPPYYSAPLQNQAFTQETWSSGRERNQASRQVVRFSTPIRNQGCITTPGSSIPPRNQVLHLSTCHSGLARDQANNLNSFPSPQVRNQAFPFIASSSRQTTTHALTQTNGSPIRNQLLGPTTHSSEMVRNRTHTPTTCCSTPVPSCLSTLERNNGLSTPNASMPVRKQMITSAPSSSLVQTQVVTVATCYATVPRKQTISQATGVRGPGFATIPKRAAGPSFRGGNQDANLTASPALRNEPTCASISSSPPGGHQAPALVLRTAPFSRILDPTQSLSTYPPTFTLQGDEESTPTLHSSPPPPSTKK
ncbi:uncharacterized protein [Ambystoma mexicanum]|uniref:uncharacterized protein n=1 Tax=Ambystoma mexicanum TaxID=8296 RepID=UPI0037E7F8A6